MSSDETARKKSKGGVTRFLGKDWWQGIGSIAGVLSVPIALLSGASGSSTDAKPESVQSSPPPASATSTPTPTPTPPPSSEGAPLAVTLVEVEPNLEGGGDHILPKPVRLSSQELNELNRLEEKGEVGEVESWFEEHGSAAINVLRVKVVVEGTPESGVRITQVSARKKCAPPYRGTLFHSLAGGADDPVTRLGFDLDTPGGVSIAQKITDEWDFAGPFFAEKTISLKRGEDRVLYLYARTNDHSCSFRFVIDALAHGTQHKIVIDDHGRPFKVTARLVDAAGNPDLSQYTVAYTSDEQSGYKWRRVH